jgi:hypothetical protein
MSRKDSPVVDFVVDFVVVFVVDFVVVVLVDEKCLKVKVNRLTYHIINYFYII